MKKIFKILLIVVILGMIFPQITHAAFFDITTTVMSKFFLWLASLFAYVAGLVLTVVGMLLNWAMGMNTTILNGAAVKIGWVIVRDVANLGFVLSIIIIAFATILRITSYEAKTILWKLVVAALLINFSLVISGIFIDSANLMTEYFLNQATGDHPTMISSKLAEQMQVQKLYAPKSADDPTMVEIGTMGNTDKMFVLLGSIAFVVIFSTVLIIVLSAMVLMLLYRYFMLSFLVILMPLAWMGFVLPYFSSLWSQWWSNFLKWTLFGPAVTFFIYLAITVSATMANDPGMTSLNGSFAGMAVTIGGFGSIIGQMIIICGLLVGGLIAAEKMGIEGAAMAKGLATSATKSIISSPITGTRLGAGFIQRLARTAGNSPVQRVEDPTTGKVSYKGGTWAQRIGRWGAGAPVIGGAARALNSWSAAGVAEKDKARRDEFKGMDKGALYAMASTLRSDSNPARLTAYLAAATEAGITGDLDRPDSPINPGAMVSMVKAANAAGTAKEAFKKNPLLARHLAATTGNQAQGEAEIIKVIESINIAAVDDKVLSSAEFKPEYFLSASKAGIRTMVNDPEKSKHLDAIKTKIEGEYKTDANGNTKDGNIKDARGTSVYGSGQVIGGDQKKMYDFIKFVIDDNPAAQRTTTPPSGGGTSSTGYTYTST